MFSCWHGDRAVGTWMAFPPKSLLLMSAPMPRETRQMFCLDAPEAESAHFVRTAEFSIHQGSSRTSEYVVALNVNDTIRYIFSRII